MQVIAEEGEMTHIQRKEVKGKGRFFFCLDFFFGQNECVGITFCFVGQYYYVNFGWLSRVRHVDFSKQNGVNKFSFFLIFLQCLSYLCL